MVVYPRVYHRPSSGMAVAPQEQNKSPVKSTQWNDAISLHNNICSGGILCWTCRNSNAIGAWAWRRRRWRRFKRTQDISYNASERFKGLTKWLVAHNRYKYKIRQRRSSHHHHKINSLKLCTWTIFIKCSFWCLYAMINCDDSRIRDWEGGTPKLCCFCGDTSDTNG